MLKKNQKGFTLVEMSIVIVVIGILLGGIIKGQEFITNAKVTRIMKDIKSIEAVTLAFHDQYDGFPGDVPARFIPDCEVGNPNFCEGGDENGQVGAVEDGTPANSKNWKWVFRPQDEEMETYQFWKHLALTDYITSVDITGDPDNAAWGVTHPASPFEGGYEFHYDAMTAVGFQGNILRISSDGLNPTSVGTNLVDGDLSPEQGSWLDLKMDDGHPDDGIVMADYGFRSTRPEGGNDCKDNGVYMSGNSNAFCSMFILFK